MSAEAAARLERMMHEKAAEAFDITASCFDQKEADAFLALFAQVFVQMGPYWHESRPVREMLERYAALDSTYPYQPK